MELNSVELALKEIYDGWQLGNECENNGYSAMFRMGFPDEYIDSDRPLLMYVGQECLHGNKEKTQQWIRDYQIVQRTKTFNSEINEGTRNSPFWNFYRRLCDDGYNVLWNNLDKFHPENKQRLSWEQGIRFNSPYGEDKLSVLQREIKELKPKVVVLVVGNKKYTASLASAFSVSEEELKKYEPNTTRYLSEISSVLGLENISVLWTYHPAYLQRKKLYCAVLQAIKEHFAIEKRSRKEDSL